MVNLEDLGEDKKEFEDEEKEMLKINPLKVEKCEVKKFKIPKGRKALEYIIEFRGVNRMNLEPKSLGNRNPKNIIWRLEIEGTNTYKFNIMRNNLYLLLMKYEFKKQKNYIAMNHAPNFEEDEVLDKYETIFSNYVDDLNEAQKIAVIRSLGAKDFQ